MSQSLTSMKCQVDNLEKKAPNRVGAHFEKLERLDKGRKAPSQIRLSEAALCLCPIWLISAWSVWPLAVLIA